jgi:hypothetical protein
MRSQRSFIPGEGKTIESTHSRPPHKINPNINTLMMNAAPLIPENDMVSTQGDICRVATPTTVALPPSNSNIAPPVVKRAKRIGIILPSTMNTDGCSNNKKRRVYIQPEPQQIHKQESGYDTDKKELWYSAQELSECRREAKQLCEEVDIEDVIHGAYALAASPPLSPLDNNRFKQAQKLQKRLLRRSADFERQRGLERCSSASHGLSCNLHMLQAKTEIFLAQANQMILLGHSDPAELSKVYTDASKQAVCFARLLGETDAAFARPRTVVRK